MAHLKLVTDERSESFNKIAIENSEPEGSNSFR